MSGLSSYVYWLWAFSVLAQLVVLVLLLINGNYRKLFFFTTYVVLNLCQAGVLFAVYRYLGTESEPVKIFAWFSEYVTLLAAALATTEILQITLKPYQGIWGLGWRVLAAVSAVVMLLVALASYGHWASARWFEINRGYHLTFASAVLACLLLIRYYLIPVPAAYKMMLGGFCFYSCTEILINTLIQALMPTKYYDYPTLWQFSTILSFAAVQVLWMAALRRPLPIEDREAAQGSDSDYQRLSPEINERLRRLNEKLMRLWKMEARPH